MLTPLKPITTLPEHVVNQIKAGEVVERPANVIKELIENSLDAGATQIDISLSANGLESIIIKDNGHGIGFEDLPKAFERHCTSKISQFSDLYALNTFGFRGEALASIASVAKVTCTSFTQTNQGGELSIADGKVATHSKRTQGEQGTIFSINELFYNTPVRLKFMQSTSSEKSWIKKFIYPFILANPQCSFNIQWDQEAKLLYPKCNSFQERLAQFYSARHKKSLNVISLKKSYLNNSLELILYSAEGKPHFNFNLIMINQRIIFDKRLQAYLKEFIDKYQLPFKHYFLNLKLKNDEIDINVHPHKTQIKYFDSNGVFAMVAACLNEILKKTRKSTDIPVAHENENSNTKPIYRFEDREDLYLDHLNPSTSEASNLICLDHEYYLVKEESNLCLLNQKELFTCYLDHHLSQPVVRIPLFIAAPLPEDLNDSQIKYLDKYFEIEKLKNGTQLIKEIPSFIKGFSLKPMIDYLIRGDFQIEELKLSHAQIHQLLKLEELDQSRFLKPFSPAQLWQC